MHERRYAARNRSERSRDGSVAAHCSSAAVRHTGKSVNTHAGARWQPAVERVHVDRFSLAVTVCIPAVLAYNWWLIVPFRHGLLTSVNSFFSDLEVKGAPDASVFGKLDVIAGALFLAALLLSYRRERPGRAEWRLFVTFAIAAGAGGLFPFSCAEGTDSACRHRGMASAIALPPLRARAAVRSRIPLRHDRLAARVASHATKRCTAHCRRPSISLASSRRRHRLSATGDRVFQRPVRGARRARLLRRVRSRGIHRGRRER